MKQTHAGFKTAEGHRAPELLVRFGPTLLVDIGFESVPDADRVPNLAAKRVKALVDTGASDSCIDDDLAKALHLPIIDQRACSGIGGMTRVNSHLAQIYIPTLDHTLLQSFAGVKLAAGGQWHQALLGRTFLSKFRLTYDGPTGEVLISEWAASS